LALIFHSYKFPEGTKEASEDCQHLLKDSYHQGTGVGELKNSKPWKLGIGLSLR